MGNRLVSETEAAVAIGTGAGDVVAVAAAVGEDSTAAGVAARRQLHRRRWVYSRQPNQTENQPRQHTALSDVTPQPHRQFDFAHHAAHHSTVAVGSLIFQVFQAQFGDFCPCIATGR